MGRFYRYFHVVVTISIFMTACSTPAVQTQQTAPNPTKYMELLGKPLNDRGVLYLLQTTNCTPTTQFQLCKDMGIALWVDTDQVVREIYLYLNNTDGFAPYKGELPLTLKFYDTLGAVEYKLRRLEANGTTASGATEVNYEGSSPDHMHYWVNYDPYGFTVIYNSPFPDEDATIYAILLHS